eukprot:gnl/TRDRNA2_/TRDRNA2_78204_c0_seq1.p1 gnl/TRDRNA2_/TRDRNA2_78204_c0~~gnl/TRDRNA2_/TRDRNA2_78204_c0_seq1.p1  ORF type:complete len:236 (-),score=46.26 gnl/TRDRNA2_/TRDRNA2_78204_c0_seq1:46-732(-)
MQLSDDKLFATLAQVVRQQARKFKPRSLADTSWAFAKVSYSHDLLFAELAEAIQERVHELDLHSLINSAWALATARRSDRALFAAIASAAERSLDAVDTEGLTRLAWAFRTIGRSDENLFAALAQVVQRRGDEFRPEDLATMENVQDVREDFGARRQPELMAELPVRSSIAADNVSAGASASSEADGQRSRSEDSLFAMFLRPLFGMLLRGLPAAIFLIFCLANFLGS